MSSKPITWWLTEATCEQLFAKVDQLVRDIGDKRLCGYDVAADVVTSMWGPRVRRMGRSLHATGMLLVMLTAHAGFYRECSEAEGQNQAEFVAFVGYLNRRMGELVSAQTNLASEVIYDLVFFATQRKDPLGLERRRHQDLPVMRPIPFRQPLHSQSTNANAATSATATTTASCVPKRRQPE